MSHHQPPEQHGPILLPCTSLDGGLHAKERIAARIECKAFRQGQAVAINITVHAVVEEYQKDEGKDSFLQRVDEALKRIQKGGDDDSSAVGAYV